MMPYIWVSPVLAGVSVTEPYLGVWLVFRVTVAVIDHLHGFISYPHTGNNCSSLTCKNINIQCKKKQNASAQLRLIEKGTFCFQNACEIHFKNESPRPSVGTIERNAALHPKVSQ